MPPRPSGLIVSPRPQGPSILRTQAPLNRVLRVQEHFRFRNDDGTEVTATWREPLDTNELAMPIRGRFRLRVAVANRGDLSISASNNGLALVFRRNRGAWTTIFTTSGSAIQGYTSSADNTITTQQISSGAFAAFGKVRAGGSSSSSQLLPGETFEAEWSCIVNIANVDDLFEFRVADSATSVPIDDYDFIPSFVAVPAESPVTRPLPFRIFPGPIGGPPILTAQEPLDVAAAVPADIVVSIGQAAETDTAQGLSFFRAATLAQAIETDTAQTVSFFRTAALIQAIETDAAQALTLSALLSGLRQLLTLRLRPGRVVGPPVLMTQRPLEPAPFTAATLTPAAETDTAQALSITKDIFKTLTPATETDTAQALSAAHIESITQATETDTAQALTFYRAATLGQATEVDTAQILSITKTIFMTLTQALEADTAQPLLIAGFISVALRQIIALKLRPGRVGGPPVLVAQRPLEPIVFTSVTISPATETDTARALTGFKTASLTPAAETDTARTLTARKELSIVNASETDTAQALGLAKTLGITKATETDTAQPLTKFKSVGLVQATETDTARGQTMFKTVTISTASETDTAQVIYSPFRGFHLSSGRPVVPVNRTDATSASNRTNATSPSDRTDADTPSNRTDSVLTGSGRTDA